MTGADLDHVAIGAWSMDQVAGDFARRLGGREIARFAIPSWAGLQLRFAGGIRLEVLEPVDNPADDFLQRFLERSGTSPHHMTFKVKDIRAALGALGEHGIEPVKVNLANPAWQEAFLHPALGLGTVVQLAQQGGPWSAEREPEPAPPGSPAAEFLGAEVACDPAAAATVFGEILGGARRDAGGRVAYSWPGGGTVRTGPVEPGARSRVTALVFRDIHGDGPALEPGEEVLFDGPARLRRLSSEARWPD